MATQNQLQACFICLKQLKVFSPTPPSKSESFVCEPLYSKFIGFVRNCLQIAVENPPYQQGDNHDNSATTGVPSFCSVCSERVSELCGLYKELCVKLEKFGMVIKAKNLDTDIPPTSSFRRAFNIENKSCELRNAILLKCFQKSEPVLGHLKNLEFPKTSVEVLNEQDIKEEVESFMEDDDGNCHNERSDSDEDSDEVNKVQRRTRNHNRNYAARVSTDSNDEKEEAANQLENEERRSRGDDSCSDISFAALSESGDDSKSKCSSESGSEDEQITAKVPPPRRTSPRKATTSRRKRATNFPYEKLLACEATGCRAFFKDIPELNSHLKTHSTTIYPCSECNRGYLLPELLELHKLLHTKKTRGKYPCPSCHQTFENTKGLQTHHNIKHGLGLGCFKCPKCELNLASEHSFSSHLTKHAEAEDPTLPITEASHCIAAPPCSACGMQFLRLQNLDDHRRTAHQLGVECLICKKVLSNRGALIRHMTQIHKPPTEHRCTHCVKVYTTREALLEHIVVVHSTTLGREATHQCPHCLERFHRGYLLKHHLRKCSKNPDPNKILPLPIQIKVCQICGRPVHGSNKSLQRHLKTHEPKTFQPKKKEDRPSPSTKKKTPCHIVKKRKRSKPKEKVSKPKRREKSQGPFICEICGQQFLFRNTLTRHLNRRHGVPCIAEKKFICQFCGIGCTSQTNLNKHQVVHTEERNFACHLCPYKSYYNTVLKGHLRTIHGKVKGEEFTLEEGPHKNKLKWKCRFLSCKKDFTEELELKTHVENEHDKDTPFMCKLCGRVFANQQRLTRHGEVHSQEKRYKCPICGKGLSQQNSVKEHVLVVHGVGKEQKFVTCTQPNCQAKVKAIPHLYRHLRLVHGIYTGKPRSKSQPDKG